CLLAAALALALGACETSDGRQRGSQDRVGTIAGAIDGATEQAHGTVCSDSDGRWRIVRWPDTPKIHAIIGGAV
ncbi:MAG: hypothetical protein V3R63_05545, partial [Alphaproteobacteria bacterium]